MSQTVLLGDEIELIGGGTPKTSVSEYWGGDIPWLSVVDFGGDSRWVDKAEKSITEAGLKNSSTKLLQAGDIIISARGTVGELAQLKSAMAFNQSCYGIRAKANLDQDYLYYLLKQSIADLQRQAHGGVFSTITRETFQHIKVQIPDLKEQVEIANILGKIDEKIELNRQMNETLEQIGQSLFKYHFINNLKSKVWDKVPLRDITKLISRGMTPIYDERGEYRVINQRCIRNQRLNLENARWQSKEVKGDKLLQPGDVLINSTGVGTLGRVAQVNNTLHKVTVDSHVTIVRPVDNIDHIFFGLLLLGMENTFASMGRGTTGQTELSREAVGDLIITLPPQEKMKEFGGIVVQTRDLITKNEAEISSLTQLRDSLLPRLISGKINPDGKDKDSI